MTDGFKFKEGQVCLPSKECVEETHFWRRPGNSRIVWAL